MQTPVQFINWASKHYPEQFIAAADAWLTPATETASLGDIPPTYSNDAQWETIPPTVAGFIKDLGNQILAYQQERDLTQVNIARINAGLPPIGPYAASSGGISISGGGIQGNGLMLLLVAGGAALLLSRGGGRRRNKRTRGSETTSWSD